MDSVELLEAFEEAFDIVITDEMAESLRTVGDAHRAILSLLAAKGTPQNAGDVYELLVRIITCQMAVRPEKLAPETRFVDDLKID